MRQGMTASTIRRFENIDNFCFSVTDLNEEKLILN